MAAAQKARRRAATRPTRRKADLPHPLVAAVDRIIAGSGLAYIDFGDGADAVFRERAGKAFLAFSDFLSSTDPEITPPLPRNETLRLMWTLSLMRAAAPRVDLTDPAIAAAFMLGVELTDWPHQLIHKIREGRDEAARETEQLARETKQLKYEISQAHGRRAIGVKKKRRNLSAADARRVKAYRKHAGNTPTRAAAQAAAEECGDKSASTIYRALSRTKGV